MLHALWIAGAVFVGLMGGLGFAATYDPVKWSDAVTAIGTVIAAIGTVGTLGYQVIQTAKAQRQLRIQALLGEQMESELLQMWLRELRHVLDYHAIRLQFEERVSDDELAAWNGDLSLIRDKFKEGRTRINSRLGHRMYLAVGDVLGLASSLVNGASSDYPRSNPEYFADSFRELSDMLSKMLDQATEWRRDLDLRLANDSV